MRSFLIFAVIGTVLFMSTVALAEPPCNARKIILAELAGKYREAPIAIGVTSAGALIEVLTTSDGNTWTILLSTPDGISCLLFSGDGWKSFPFKLLEPKV